MSHRDMPYLLLLLIFVYGPPMLVFPSRQWARRLGSLGGFGCLALALLCQVMAYGSHWNFSGDLFDATGAFYADGCVVDNYTRAIAVTGHPRLIWSCLFLALAVVGGLCQWNEKRTLKRQRRDAIAATQRESGGMYWLD